MEVRFVTPDTRRLDELKYEALVLPFCSDERPLRGVLGLMDWRLVGRVSKLILRGRITGASGEVVLIAARPRTSFDKLFLVGAGPAAEMDERRFSATVEKMMTTLDRARVRASVLALPGRAFDRVAPARAMELFLRAAARHPEQDVVTLVEELEPQRAMVPVVEREKRRARAVG